MTRKSLRFLRALGALFNKKTWGPFTEAYAVTKFDHGFSVSWSQAGEDLAILPILNSIAQGRYLDIGAHHPTRFSVTRHLFQNGWSGVNVDANFDLIDEFEKNRVGDINLNLCVGTEDSYEISIFQETAISTVNSIWRDRFISEKNQLLEVRRVNGVTLRSLIETYFSSGDLDFLNIDIEGADLDAVVSADFKNLSFELWPKWILLEAVALKNPTSDTPAVKYLLNFGYHTLLVLPFAVLLQKPSPKN